MGTIIGLNHDFVSLEISVEDNFGMISIGYDDANTKQRQCYQDFNVTEGDQIPIDAACYEEYASLTVFFYIGEDIDVDDCEACSLPSDGTEDYVAIVFEIPCQPCELTGEPSSAPSKSPI